eukprot:2446667-Rhodomonas_salina.1
MDALTADRSAAASPCLERLILGTKWGRPQPPGPPARPPSVPAEEEALRGRGKSPLALKSGGHEASQNPWRLSRAPVHIELRREHWMLSTPCWTRNCCCRSNCAWRGTERSGSRSL